MHCNVCCLDVERLSLGSGGQRTHLLPLVCRASVVYPVEQWSVGRGDPEMIFSVIREGSLVNVKAAWKLL